MSYTCPIIKVRPISKRDIGFDPKSYGDSALVIDHIVQATWRPIQISEDDLFIIQNMMDEVFKLGKSARSKEILNLLRNKQ